MKVKNIPNFPNYYVSNDGKIFKELDNGAAVEVNFRFENQYKKVEMINFRGRKAEFPIHKLVAESFCEGRLDKSFEAHHKNSNRHDNRASNLIWLSHEAHKKLHRMKLMAEGRWDLVAKYHSEVI